MLYSHLDLWTETDGEIWHALRRPGTRDLSMGTLRPFEVKRIVAWARSHRLTVTDLRKTKPASVAHQIADRALDTALAA